ncbi:hypothetical protein C8R44DRAFT_732647 [Mycena epipterygia]|nr:hypothetical protein C8R44DRAFT_732647 [Mycena epipterygia]
MDFHMKPEPGIPLGYLMVFRVIDRDVMHQETVHILQAVLDGIHLGSTQEITPGADKTALIKSDAQYLLKRNGPAFHNHPMPEHLSLSQKPGGYLQSDAIIGSIAPFIARENFKIVIIEDSKVNYQASELPTGTLCMGAAAVERCYDLYRTGVRTQQQK